MKRVLEQRFASRVVCLLFRLLDHLWQKDRELMVFYGGRGAGYSDNTRFLFERFIEAYGSEFKIRWVTPSEDMLRDTSIDEKWREHMVYMFSKRGILTLLSTKVVFFSWAAPGFSSIRETEPSWHWDWRFPRLPVSARSSRRDYLWRRWMRQRHGWSTCSSLLPARSRWRDRR